MKQIAFAVLGLALVAGAQANLISNGSFQDGAGTTATDWTLAGSQSLALTDEDYRANAGGSGSSPYGGRFLSFNAGEAAADNSASQTFATVAGTTYVLSFAHANFGASTLQNLGVSLADSSAGVLASTTIADSTGSTALGRIWDTSSLTFTAASGWTTLTFSDAGSTTNSTDLFVDNVSVEAVPEPATLTALGLGLLALRRRKRA